MLPGEKNSIFRQVLEIKASAILFWSTHTIERPCSSAVWFWCTQEPFRTAFWFRFCTDPLFWVETISAIILDGIQRLTVFLNFGQSSYFSNIPLPSFLFGNIYASKRSTLYFVGTILFLEGDERSDFLGWYFSTIQFFIDWRTVQISGCRSRYFFCWRDVDRWSEFLVLFGVDRTSLIW